LNSKKLIYKIVENWPAKVLSIAIALILFVFNRMNTLTTRNLSVPLVIETDESLIPSNAYIKSVRVTLRGEDDSIKSILDRDIEAYVDFSRHEIEGWYRAPVQIRRKESARNVEPLEIAVTPMEISVQLERKASKSVPLIAMIRGKVASGYDLVSHSVSPSEIVVSGPVSIMDSLNEIRTDPIDLDGRNGDFGIIVNIINPNPVFVIKGSSMAEFNGQVKQSVPVRNYEGIPILLSALDPAFEAYFENMTGSVRLEGNQNLLDNFIPADGFLSVDCSELIMEGIYLLPVTVNLPSGFTLIRNEPKEINLTVTEKGE